MQTHRACLMLPAGSVRYRRVADGGHKSLNVTSKILDFPPFGKCTWGFRNRVPDHRAAGRQKASRKLRIASTTLARLRETVARAGDPPHSEHRTSAFVLSTTRTTSGKETLMVRPPPNSLDRRFSRLGEKNITRHQANRLPSRPSCKNAGTERPSGLTHGATDANGR
jgi:hypothetical protein